MKSISVSELKANLSRYLREVRRGGEIQILDRGDPIARLTGLGHHGNEKEDVRRERLVRGGVLRAGTGQARRILEAEPLDLGTSLLDALRADREDRL